MAKIIRFRSRSLLFWSLLSFCLSVEAGAVEANGEVVVLVHGMGRTRLSMLPLAHFLGRCGYRVINWHYDSSRASIQGHADGLHAEVQRLEMDSSVRRIHFVSHSLGGIIIRCLLAEHPSPKAGRVVMLAPPNQGSGAADRYRPFLESFQPPIRELTTDTGSFVRRLRPVPGHIAIGVIAGSHDRKVSVAETRLDEQADHLVVRSGHTFIMAHPEAQAAIARFLRSGAFAVTDTARAAAR